MRVPAAASHVWYWFRELDTQRGSNGYGPNPISYTEIKAWADLRGHKLKQWQIDAFISMDVKRRVLAAKASEESEKLDKKDEISERPLSSALFDALFPSQPK